MAGFFASLFGGTKQERDVKRLDAVVMKIEAEKDWADSIKFEDFPKWSAKWREELKEGKETLSTLLPKAYALASRAASIILGETPHRVQLMGGVVLNEGSILEMKTGEGKTLTAVLSAYLNALSGDGVHIVTVNDYLAKRDAEWMGPIYNALGLKVGVVYNGQDEASKREAYSADVTYGTNNEFGFDYLRDNMKQSYASKVQPKHAYAIVDEIDSILIDEARTPLIISGLAEDDSDKVKIALSIVPFLKECEKDPATGRYYERSASEKLDAEASASFDERGDFKLDEKSKGVSFTAEGMEHIEELLKRNKALHPSKDKDGNEVYDLYDSQNFELVHYVIQAVKAEKMYKRDTDYIVKNGEVQIVDEFTGRVLIGRRFSEGLHQAIEAKEHVEIKAQNKTYATITFQNFFRMYAKLSGMTGTAETEALEFKEIYNLDVVVVPTDRPVIRKDEEDLTYYSEEMKFNAIVEDVKRIHATGQPILIGTTSIEKSEKLSALLRRAGLRHEVLNAKNHEREAWIIGEAGAKGAITIATNMAGRGTDIKLGGSIEHLAEKKHGTNLTPEEFLKAKEDVFDEWKRNYEEVKALGGLSIIGSERHESRRIDNQLRGRSGRQGDPGSSRFYISLDDPLMRLFAKEGLKELLGRMGLKSGEPIHHRMLDNSIESAQKKVEERNFSIRKRLLDYDNVLNDERNFIYRERDEILKDDNLTSRVVQNASDMIEEAWEETRGEREKFLERLRAMVQWTPPIGTPNTLYSIKKSAEKEIQDKATLLPPGLFNAWLRSVYLQNIDREWVEHLDVLEEIKDASSLQGYAQKDPLVEYKKAAVETYEEMLERISESVVRASLCVRVNVNTSPRRASSPRKITLGQSTAPRRSIVSSRAEGENITVRRTGRKIGRNEPCPCGSGKKYKNCCGRRD